MAIPARSRCADALPEATGQRRCHSLLCAGNNNNDYIHNNIFNTCVIIITNLEKFGSGAIVIITTSAYTCAS